MLILYSVVRTTYYNEPNIKMTKILNFSIRCVILIIMLAIAVPPSSARSKKRRHAKRHAVVAKEDKTVETVESAEASENEKKTDETAKKVKPASSKTQQGRASYYSRRAHGARTSSGVRLDNNAMVCAHKTHPFGTKLLVKNPANGREVVVKVVDRGPFVRGRVIDLSYAAAKALGMIAAGVAVVEVSVYDDTSIPYRPKDAQAPELDLEVPTVTDKIF